MAEQIFLASLLHFPLASSNPEQDVEFIQDGCLVMRDGKILETGNRVGLAEKYPDARLNDYRGKLIVPGLIDSHLHFPQTEMIASHGEQLLEWLTKYTFPTEKQFEQDDYSARMAEVFLRQLLKNGTTTALVFSSVHKGATDALFAASANKNMLMVAGKVCMDRNCPADLMDTPELAQRESADLIEKWHGKQRQYYALTPRFAPTSSPEQLHVLGELAQQYPDTFIQTHLSENPKEIEWVRSLFPHARDYLDVYQQFNLVRPRAVFGHSLHLSEREWQALAECEATIAFCPTSNLFLGSGLFDLQTASEHKIAVNLATDVGAGTSFSMLKTLGEAYKVCQLRDHHLSPLHGFYMMTQGAAVSLGLEDQIGNLNPGTDADFVVIDPAFDELTALRTAQDRDNPSSLVFALSMLADDRAIESTWIRGSKQYEKL